MLAQDKQQLIVAWQTFKWLVMLVTAFLNIKSANRPHLTKAILQLCQLVNKTFACHFVGPHHPPSTPSNIYECLLYNKTI